jgi:prolipoprotein diacylglyceryltransferase
LNAVYLIWGGNVFYGGLLGGIFAAVIILKKRQQCRCLPDFITPAIPLFHFLEGQVVFGRVLLWDRIFFRFYFSSFNCGGSQWD